MRSLLWISFFPFFSAVSAVLVNVTIDDTQGDPLTGLQITYDPPGSWKSSSGCVGCESSPDGNLAHLQTWHEGTFNTADGGATPSLATVPFSGSSLRIFCILSLQPEAFPPDLTFYVDREEVGSYRKPNPPGFGFIYDHLVFSTDSLSNTTHTLTIQNGRSGGVASTVLLDYIVYFVDRPRGNERNGGIASENSDFPPLATNGTARTSTPQPLATEAASTASSHSRGKVLGGILGTLFGLLFLGIAFVFYRGYRRRQASEPQLPHNGTRSSQQSFFQRWVPTKADLGFTKRKDQTQSTFDPQMFVRRLANRTMPSLHRSSPPQHRPNRHGIPYPASSLHSTDFLPNTPGHNHVPPPSAMMLLPSSRVASIQQWQRQTEEETRDMSMRPSTPPMSEDLSSYYEDNATVSQRIRTPPPPRRHFTVMNN